MVLVALIIMGVVMGVGISVAMRYFMREDNLISHYGDRYWEHLNNDSTHHTRD
ncbi:MAG: hypothetical protein OHK0046_45160 [Anaerolineae bacterium]